MARVERDAVLVAQLCAAIIPLALARSAVDRNPIAVPSRMRSRSSRERRPNAWFCATPLGSRHAGWQPASRCRTLDVLVRTARERGRLMAQWSLLSIGRPLELSACTCCSNPECLPRARSCRHGISRGQARRSPSGERRQSEGRRHKASSARSTSARRSSGTQPTTPAIQ